MRILNVKRDTVLLGVEGKNVTHHPELVEVTFTDDYGQPRTVFAHVEGPFQEPGDIARAAIDGTLHVEKEHPEGFDKPTPPAGPVVAGGPRGGQLDNPGGYVNG